MEQQTDWIDWQPSEYPDFPGYKVEGTSKQAAQKIAVRADTIRARVLELFTERFPQAFTADQVANELHLSAFTVRPRVSELHAAGLIEQVPERRQNDSGMTAACWRASQHGIAEAPHA